MRTWNRIKKPPYLRRFIPLSIIIVITFGVALIQIRPSDIVALTQQMYAKAMKFNMILDKIERFYVDERRADELVEYAIQGMLSDLDPFTTYLSVEEYDRYKQEMDGYYGIGIKYDQINNHYVIISVEYKSPAFKHGLQHGDKILTIDGIPVVSLRYSELTYRLNGHPNTQVHLQIIRNGWTEPKEYIIPREQIITDSIPISFMITPEVGFIKIARFTSTTAEELDIAFAQLRGEGMKSLILDLRDNTGGELVGAETVADRFVSGGKIIVYTKGRTAVATERYIATDRATLPICPLVVLVNSVTASGAEIVAGAIQDWDRGLIVGETTFGKALVQSEFPFQDGSALLLTTARYYTPLGRMIQKSYEKERKHDHLKAKGKSESTQDRPLYRTPSGRLIYGGGGIVPDVILQSKPLAISESVRKLYDDREHFFFTFANEYVNSHPDITQDILSFINHFFVDELLWRDFTQKVSSSGFKFTQAEFNRNVAEIKFLLKQELARRIWGDQGALQFFYSQDSQVVKSLDFIDDAATLLNR